ncbi:hypothetical protein Tco_0491040 [Tanacetum coccineum]
MLQEEIRFETQSDEDVYFYYKSKSEIEILSHHLKYLSYEFRVAGTLAVIGGAIAWRKNDDTRRVPDLVAKGVVGLCVSQEVSHVIRNRKEGVWCDVIGSRVIEKNVDVVALFHDTVSLAD